MNEIHVYADGAWHNITDESIVVLRGTEYDFKAVPYPSAGWPNNEPLWSGAKSGNGEIIYDVNFPSTGIKSLTAKCCYGSGKTVTIQVVEPTVYQVGFGGDNLLYKDPNANSPDYWGGWGDGNEPFTDPVYDSNASTAKNDPVCVTKNSSSLSLTNVKLKVTEALSYDTSIRVDANGTIQNWLSGTTSFGSSDTTSGEATNININTNIIDQVKIYAGNFQIQWSYKVPSGTNTWYTINTTSHTMYVTWGPPSGSSVTEKRIEFVCDSASGIGGTNPTIPANAVFSDLSNVFDLNGPTWGPSPIWRLHNPDERSQCPGIADYVNKHFQMLGLGSGVIRYCHAKPDGTYEATSYDPGTYWRTIVPGDGHPDPTSHDDDYPLERLAHIDGNGNANAYEATCLFNGYHYACAIGAYTTAEGVVEAAFTSVQWQYRTGASSPYTFYECTEDPWIEAP